MNSTNSQPKTIPAGAADPLFSGRRHYPELDGLRALAIMAVIGLHFCACIPAAQVTAGGWPVQLAVKIFSHGAWGVDLFFVLSGYLITGILLSSKGQAHYFRNFYARRTLRIFPLYYGTLFAVLILVPAMLGHVPKLIAPAYQNQGWLWTYTANIQCALVDGQIFGNFLHFWTLCIEEQFYLIWPLVIFVMPPRWLLRFALSGIILVNAGRLLFIIAEWHPTVGWYPVPVYNWLASMTFFRADSLLAGAAMSILQANNAISARRVLFWSGFAASGAATVAYVLLGPAFIYGLPMAVIAHVTLAPILFGCGLGLLLSGTPKSWVRGMLSQPLLRTIGKYSYAMYVFHYIYMPLQVKWLPYSLFLRFLHLPVIALAAYYAAAVGIAFGLAFASYHLFEKHFLKLKAHFPETAPAAGASAAALPEGV